MKKKYTSAEILDMALKKAEARYYADLDRNGEVNVTDARIALQNEGKKLNGTSSSVESSDTVGTGAFGAYDSTGNTLLKKELIDSVMAQTGTGYDINSDKIYNDYKNEYEKSALKAAKNVYGLASSNTGGYGSSYAASAAASAYGEYLSRLAEKLPEFAEKASSIRKTELQNKLNVLDALRKDDSDTYSRFSDSVKNAWKAAENGDYSFLESLGVSTDELRERKAFEEAAELAKHGDYSGFDYLGVDMSGQRRDDELQRAVTLAKYGDYSALKRLGVDTSTAEYAELLSIAEKTAEKGDYSMLEALGVNVGGLREKDLLEKAVALAKYGDYSLLGSFTSNLSALKDKISVTVQKGASAAYSAGGYRGLVNYLNRQINYGQITENGKKQIIKALTGN